MADPLGRRLDKNVARAVGRDVEDELAFHLEMRVRELQAEGLSLQDAREKAQRLFGDQETIAAQCRKQTRSARRSVERSWRMERLVQDLRYGFRRLVREPGFAAAAILTLALGIGANTAVFSVLDAVLLRPLPFPDSERLVALWEINDEGTEIGVTYPNFVDWKEQGEAFEGLAMFGNWGGVTITGEFEARTARRTTVSAGFHDLLQVPPVEGRLLNVEDHQLGAPPVVMIGETLWRGALGGQDLEDLSITLDGEQYQVIGVVEAGREFPEGSELWTPHERVQDLSSRTAHNYRVIARLPSEGTMSDVESAAQAEMTAIAARLAQEYEGDITAVDVAVRPWHEEIVSGSRKPLWLLLCASGLLLVVACANLAGSLLARAFSRRREMAVRSAIGAGQGGLMQQLIVESLLLALLGCLGGLAVAAALTRGLLAAAPPNLPRLDDVGLDLRVLGFSVLVAVAAGLVLGMVPAWSLLKTPLRKALAGTGEFGGRHRLWNLLVGTEVALALVLLVGAGLLLGSLKRIAEAPLGFEKEGLMTAAIEMPIAFPDFGEDLEPLLEAEKELAVFAGRLLDEMRAVAGVEQVALASSLPSQGMSTTLIYIDDRSEDEAGGAGYILVSPDYFEVMEIPLLEGRRFETGDVTEGEHVTVISESLAKKYWPEGGAIGTRIRPPGMDLHGQTWLQIVGVVGDVRQRSVTREAPSIMYVSAEQRPAGARWSSLILRADGEMDPAVLANPVRAAANAVAPDMPVAVATMEGILRSSISRQRFQVLTMTVFAGLGLLLAAGGIWAVVTFQVVERTKELGLRMALGASPSGLVRQILRRTLLVVGAGALVGLVASLFISRALASLLYEIEPGDPLVMALTALLLAAVGGAASLVPALRAARVDPLVALRADG